MSKYLCDSTPLNLWRPVSMIFMWLLEGKWWILQVCRWFLRLTSSMLSVPMFWHIRLHDASPVLWQGSLGKSQTHQVEVMLKIKYYCIIFAYPQDSLLPIWRVPHAADQSLGQRQGRLHGEPHYGRRGQDGEEHWVTDRLHKWERWKV